MEIERFSSHHLLFYLKQVRIKGSWKWRLKAIKRNEEKLPEILVRIKGSWKWRLKEDNGGNLSRLICSENQRLLKMEIESSSAPWPLSWTRSWVRIKGSWKWRLKESIALREPLRFAMSENQRLLKMEIESPALPPLLLPTATSKIQRLLKMEIERDVSLLKSVGAKLK